MKTSEKIILGIILASFTIGIWFYPRMPERMASHWNFRGEVDGYVSRCWGLFLMPFISLILVALFILLAKIDPLKENVESFRKYFDDFIILILGFLFYLYVLTIFWNLEFRFNMALAISPAFAGLFYYCGILMENSKRNWFIGIRTPWTLSSERVWLKTHKIGGKLFKIVGMISIFGILFKSYALFLIFMPILGIAIYLSIYSYLEYKKEFHKS